MSVYAAVSDVMWEACNMSATYCIIVPVNGEPHGCEQCSLSVCVWLSLCGGSLWRSTGGWLTSMCMSLCPVVGLNMHLCNPLHHIISHNHHTHTCVTHAPLYPPKQTHGSLSRGCLWNLFCMEYSWRSVFARIPPSDCSEGKYEIRPIIIYCFHTGFQRVNYPQVKTLMHTWKQLISIEANQHE